MADIPIYYYIIGILYFFFGILKNLGKGGVSVRVAVKHQEYSKNIIRLKRDMPKNRPPIPLFIIFVIISISILGAGVWIITSWLSGEMVYSFDYTTILFFLLFIIFPVYSLVDSLILTPIQSKKGKSWVAKEAYVVFDVTKELAFEKCIDAIASINADIIRVTKPRMAVALINGRKIVVSLKALQNGRTSVYIICDNLWVTVKMDAGANQKNLNLLLKAIQ